MNVTLAPTKMNSILLHLRTRGVTKQINDNVIAIFVVRDVEMELRVGLC